MSITFLNTGQAGSITAYSRGLGSTIIRKTPVTSSLIYILSNGYTASLGFTIGASISKTTSDGMNATSSLVSVPPTTLGDYIYPGTSTPPTSGLQRWSDWGGDIFDQWGHFYLYDVETNAYYIPLIHPINQADGVISTQTYSAFGGRTFTIKHGYPVQGIFKFDISVNDDKEFVFGVYGDMGSDNFTQNTNLSSSFTLSGNSYNLYYNRNSDLGVTERLYSYIIPYEQDKNKNISTYTKQNSGPGANSGNLEIFSFYTKNLKRGVNIYFSKTNDVRNWVINDLKLGSL